MINAVHAAADIQVAAAIASLLSAGLWFAASRIRAIPSVTFGGPPPEFFRSYNRQSKFNAWAAIATGISGILQTIALLLISCA